MSLFISLVRAKAEQKGAQARADRANKSWAGTETYEKTGTETCRRGPGYYSRPDKYGNVQNGGTKVQGVQILNVI